MNLSMKQKQDHGHREQTDGCLGGATEWEVGVSRCKLLYIEEYYRAQRTIFNILQ